MDHRRVLVYGVGLLAGWWLATATGCDKAEAPAASTAGGAASTPSAVPATMPADLAAGGTLVVNGTAIGFPAVQLIESADNQISLQSADVATPPNAIVLSGSMVTDGETPWRTATVDIELPLTDIGGEVTMGLFVGGIEHQLRPVKVRIELTRDDHNGPRGALSISGTLAARDPASQQWITLPVLGTLPWWAKAAGSAARP